MLKCDVGVSFLDAELASSMQMPSYIYWKEETIKKVINAHKEYLKKILLNKILIFHGALFLRKLLVAIWAENT